MKQFFSIFALIISISGFTQEKLDTIYYDSNWHGCSKTFATYYRIMTIPTVENSRKQFRDYFITGELQGEASYIVIDREDDSKSILDGEVKSFYKSGNIYQRSNWSNSLPVGEAYEFYENGNVKQHFFYSNGKIDGEVSTYDENGNLTSVTEVHKGTPNTYFTAYNEYGAMGRYDNQTLEFIPEAVSISALKTKIIKGTKYFYYDDYNGICLIVTLDAIKQYGKYFRVGVSIFNNTNTNIEFDPGQITAIGRFFKKNKNKVAEDSYINVADSCFYYDPNQVQTKDMRIWNFADYTKKVHRRQQWDQVLVALSETQAAQNASYSTSETTSLTHGTTHAYGNSNTFGSFNTNSYKSNHSVTYSTTKTFDATAAAIANERAAKNIAAYAESLEDEANAINESYLQPTTIDPQTQMAGYFLINKDKPHIIDLTIPINGVAYQFHFTEIPK